MRKMIVVTSGALMVAATLLSVPAQGATIARTVTLSAPRTAVVDRHFTLSGTVTRTPRGTTVLIQRRNRSGWDTLIRSAKTDARGHFAVRVRIREATRREFRALVRTSHGARHTRTSAVSATRVVLASTTTRSSVSTAGRAANRAAGGAAISPEGRFVAFVSGAKNLVAKDTNGEDDIFVRDHAHPGRTRRVNLSSSGQQAVAEDSSSRPSICGNGRFVAFTSDGNPLAVEDVGLQVYLRDTQFGRTTRVSNESGAWTNRTSLSADCRWVAFTTMARQATEEPDVWATDILLWDRTTGATTLVSRTNDRALNPAVSADGRYVAYVTDDRIDHGEINGPGTRTVLRHDTQSGSTVVVATEALPGPAGATTEPSISADGRYVAFDSLADGLVPGDTNGKRDVFVRDVDLGTTRLVSSGTSGPATGASRTPSLSADGRYVAFVSSASNLIRRDRNRVADAFVRDLTANRTRRVSVDAGGRPGRLGVRDAMLSGSGRFITFTVDGDSFSTRGNKRPIQVFRRGALN